MDCQKPSPRLTHGLIALYFMSLSLNSPKLAHLSDGSTERGWDERRTWELRHLLGKLRHLRRKRLRPPDRGPCLSHPGVVIPDQTILNI